MRIQAKHSETTEAIRELSENLARLGRYHSIELPDGTVLPGLLTVEQLRDRISRHPIPADLTGKRVLDIGAWDGWFSFEMERRGAEVVAVDVARQKPFLEAKKLLNSKVEYVIEDVCRLNPATLGTFDIVLFLGVLYHSKHPMLALERVCELSTGMACVESLVIDHPGGSQAPVMEFYEGSELAGQFDNWVGPNTPCLLAFCRTAGFARVEFHGTWEDRAHVTCYRKWPEIEGTSRGPELVSIENSWSRDHNFSATHDDYMTVWFTTPETDLDCDNTQVQVGPYGARPVSVQHAGGNKWQINCKLPPGLSRGWQDVRISVRGSQWSGPSRIPVDLSRSDRRASPSVVSEHLIVAKVIDGKTYAPSRVRTGVAESSVSAWVEGIPEGGEPVDVSLRLDGVDLPATYVGRPDLSGARQVNAMVPVGTEPGEYWISVRSGRFESKPVTVELVDAAP
jgi:tRNA (mo5U34)-methyltransferase